jgi:hypothetical protein
MRRVNGLALLLALAIVPGAAAKAPPDGFRVCGPATCVPLAQDAAESVAVNLFFGAASTRYAAPLPASFYALRWRWQTAAPDETAYYVPTAGAVYLLQSIDGPVDTPQGWSTLRPDAQTALAQTVSSLEPYAAPAAVHVTVAGKVVRDPTGYASLWAVGKLTSLVDTPGARWFRVRIWTMAPSPWRGTLWIGRRKPFLMRDDVVFRIPRALAARVRRGAPLG